MFKNNKLIIVLVGYVILGFFIISLSLAGSLIPSSLPSPTTHTLNDVYQKLTNNSYTASIADSFDFSTGEATSTMYTVEQIYNLIPTISSSTIATGTSIIGISGNIVVPSASDVLAGVYFGPNGATQGTIAAQTFSPSTTTISSGYYASSNLSTIDTDLVSSNIATGTNIFGVVGSNNTFDIVWSSSINVWNAGFSGSFSDYNTYGFDYCAALTEGGMSAGSWRLPTAAELSTALATSFLPSSAASSSISGLPGGFSLSSKYLSSRKSGSAYFLISFSSSGSAGTFSFPYSETVYVRCVR